MLGIVFGTDYEWQPLLFAPDIDAQLMAARRQIKRKAKHGDPVSVFARHQNALLAEPGAGRAGGARYGAQSDQRDAAGNARRSR